MVGREVRTTSNKAAALGNVFKVRAEVWAWLGTMLSLALVTD